MATEATYRKLPDIVLREELDSWALLFNPANGGVVGISPVGVALWQLLDHHNTASGMACALRERCDDVPAEVENHVAEYLQMLSKRGFIATDAAA